MKAMIDVINYINNNYEYETIEYISDELLPWLNEVHEEWVNNHLPTGQVVLDGDTVPLDNHPGNPGDTRYWNNFIPNTYRLDDRIGITMDGDNILIDENSNQNWLSYQECADVEWYWDSDEDGEGRAPSLFTREECNNVLPYYPVLPKYNWKGEFDFELGLQGNNIPFGSPYRFWSNYDSLAPSSNIYDYDSSLILDLAMDEIDENQLLDISGNDNRGNMIADYRIDFDIETRNPTAAKVINKIKLGSKDEGAY